MKSVKKNTVLIVDDDTLDVQVLISILGSEYSVFYVKDSQDAVSYAERLMPDVILLDIIMPEMDGYDVIAALKASEKTRDIPVIFMTGLGGEEKEKKGLTLGAADYIIKPFSPEIVKLRIQNQIKIINNMRLIIEKEIAEISYRTRIELLLDLSHEMLTPMNAIIGMTQIAKMVKNSDETSDCLDEIHNASQQLLKLIHDLLDIH